MAETAMWGLIHTERNALADDLAGLDEPRWQEPSLCAGWTVHDMLAHMLATAKETPGKFFRSFAGAGFSFDKMAQKDVEAERAGGPAATLAAFRMHANDTTKPPGPLQAMVVDAVVHSEDIRRPLGIDHAYAADAVTTCLDFVKRSNLLLGGKRRADGLTLRGTDIGWSSGTGPEVSGPGVALLLALTGRAARLGELSGRGVETLRSRI